MAYEIFQRTATRSETPTISVLPDGRIVLNAATSRLLQGKGVKAATILWDKTRCMVALQAAEKKDPNAYSIAFREGKSASISLKSFLNHIEWSSKKRQTVAAKWNPERRLLEAELPSKFVGSYDTSKETTVETGEK